MKSQEEIQAALDMLTTIKKNPATLTLLALPPAFEGLLPGMTVSARFCLDDSEPSLHKFVADINRGSTGKAGDATRARSAG
jgi:hypothetical protein